jgi:hypothetical protein
VDSASGKNHTASVKYDRLGGQPGSLTGWQKRFQQKKRISDNTLKEIIT